MKKLWLIMTFILLPAILSAQQDKTMVEEREIPIPEPIVLAKGQVVQHDTLIAYTVAAHNLVVAKILYLKQFKELYENCLEVREMNEKIIERREYLDSLRREEIQILTKQRDRAVEDLLKEKKRGFFKNLFGGFSAFTIAVIGLLAGIAISS